MVRLREQVEAGQAVIVEFQFQYGTIKGFNLSKAWRSDMNVFQFQYGTIKGVRSR
ncbi:hypothetical protein JCM21142_134807 [Saccharicrinis fermentans DSM 9555 = JCM 21142]|uniref:Uncharacterized protein n=1 Tax=Saccharicrinis fermentans DSM 9555 = JCM 21142 TaxID=869213 RepID=W7YUA7_9BACT|nr:hypothetical protein JCM21142_134807 [Saccharicrinis fermentans DSM 9555 = JCM 21142]